MQTTGQTLDLNALAAAIENTKRAGQFFAQPVDQTHLDNLLARSIKSATNGQLYDAWNEGAWARQGGQRLSANREAFLGAVYAEAMTRPAEA